MGTNPNLSIGDDAPDFTLEADDGSTVSLSELRGQKVALYFYPKDDTPGCTTQACDFRDAMPRIEGSGWAVFGVSPDPVDSHADFRDKYDLNFPLLADPDHSVAQQWGVWREKTTFGNTYMGIVRSTFLIDEEGAIVDIQDNVRAKGHVDRLLKQIAADEG